MLGTFFLTRTTKLLEVDNTGPFYPIPTSSLLRTSDLYTHDRCKVHFIQLSMTSTTYVRDTPPIIFISCYNHCAKCIFFLHAGTVRNSINSTSAIFRFARKKKLKNYIQEKFFKLPCVQVSIFHRPPFQRIPTYSFDTTARYRE